MVPLLFACLLVAVSGMLLRAARVAAPPGRARPGAAAWLLWLHHRLAAARTRSGWVPARPRLAARDGRTRSIGSFVAAQAYAAPVPASVPEFYPLMIIWPAR